MITWITQITLPMRAESDFSYAQKNFFGAENPSKKAHTTPRRVYLDAKQLGADGLPGPPLHRKSASGGRQSGMMPHQPKPDDGGQGIGTLL